MEKQPLWKDRLNEMMQICQDELKKTTEIGKKMLSASKTNSTLNEAYEELGQLAFKASEKGEVQFADPRVKELVSTIRSCEFDLEKIESDVKDIKKNPK